MDIYHLCQELNGTEPPPINYRKWIIHMMNNWHHITKREMEQFCTILGIPCNCICACLPGPNLAIKTREKYTIEVQRKLSIHLKIFQIEERASIVYNI